MENIFDEKKSIKKFFDEKTKRFYLIFVDLFMNISMNGFTMDLYENNEILKPNLQLSEFFNIHSPSKPYSFYTLILRNGEKEAGFIDLELDYRCLLHETLMIHIYSSNISKIVELTQEFINKLNNFNKLE